MHWNLFLNTIRLKEMRYRAVSEDPFLIVYCRGKHVTQKMCDEAVDDCLPALTFIPDWFVTSKIIKKLFTALHANENILQFIEDSGNVVFISNELGILNIVLNIILNNLYCNNIS